MPQDAQLSVRRGHEKDHGERPVVAAESVEAHVAQVTARIENRGVEVFDALGQLEVAAVVDGAAIGRLPLGSGPPGRAAVAPERVDHDVPCHSVSVVDRDARGARGAVVAREESRHLNPRSDLHPGVGCRGAPKGPFDERPPDPEVHQILVTILPWPMQLQREVLGIGPGAQEHVEHLRRPFGQRLPSSREEGMRLEVVWDTAAFQLENSLR